MTHTPDRNLVMLSCITSDSTLEITLEPRAMPVPKPHEVLVKVLAAPINPSDLGLIVGAADLATARQDSRNGYPAIVADVSPAGLRAMAGRVGDRMLIGNEGCGLVVAAGESDAAQALMGRMVAIIGGETFAEYRAMPAAACLPLPDATDARDGASCFVNPLTSLAFTEVMRREGHRAIVHTAAASNLGQMLVKICKAEGIPLVNIVRSDAQVAMLKAIGATHVINSTRDDFMPALVAAVTETGATLGFDAIGGGKLAGQMLSAMEVAAASRMTQYSRYGSDDMKQVYIYGGLDMGPTILNRSFGFTWGLGGFLLMPFMTKAGPEVVGRMRARVVAELTTTFKSHYSHEIGLVDAVNLETLMAYNAKSTGQKYLIRAHG